jgi:hypothetical protein
VLSLLPKTNSWGSTSESWLTHFGREEHWKNLMVRPKKNLRKFRFELLE